MGNILIVENSKETRQRLVRLLRDKHQIHTADKGNLAFKVLQEHEIDVIITSLELEDMSGMELLKIIKNAQPHIEIIITTDYGTIKSAVEAMKLGAYHYLTTPVDMDELNVAIERIFEKRQLQNEVLKLKKSLSERYGFENIISISPIMNQVCDIVRQIAPTKTNVLITGESGTGKELIAKAIHYLSPRKNRPLITLNCSAIPETLIESELFGHEKGAFTGATSQKKGLVELANKGTLFIDEVGDMNPMTQVKLLRFIETREFIRVGGNNVLNVDERLIFATNKNLRQEVRKKNFREDLYFRIKVVSIHIPPIRERKEDIKPLISFYLDHFAKENKKELPIIEKKTMGYLINYRWPGNVRELKNLTEALVVLNKNNMISTDDLPDYIMKMADNPDSIYLPMNFLIALLTSKGEKSSNLLKGKKLEDIEKQVIVKTLQENNNNKSKTARQLGISRITLLRKLDKYTKQK